MSISRILAGIDEYPGDVGSPMHLLDSAPLNHALLRISGSYIFDIAPAVSPGFSGALAASRPARRAVTESS